MNLLTLIVLLPLAGFVLNGLAGNRLGKGFVSVVGCGLPIVAFMATVRAFLELQATGGSAGRCKHAPVAHCSHQRRRRWKPNHCGSEQYNSTASIAAIHAANTNASDA